MQKGRALTTPGFITQPPGWGQIAKEKGWLRKDAPWSKYEQNVSVLDMKGLTAEEMTRLRESAFRYFYLYPLTIWRTLRKIKSFAELKYFLWMVKNFSPGQNKL